MSLYRFLPHLLLSILLTTTGTTLTTYSITTSYYHLRRPLASGIIGGVGGLLILIGLGYVLFRIILVQSSKTRRRNERRSQRSRRVRGHEAVRRDRDLEMGRGFRQGPPRPRPRSRGGNVAVEARV
ncbi:hypothetical protein BDZ45DRAFT_745185 [Acephala macrosclerotiorum]|nr:hypothetical protein BDZ45DRAFT_745185 [Acephala macrosclerotiorum]